MYLQISEKEPMKVRMVPSTVKQHELSSGKELNTFTRIKYIRHLSYKHRPLMVFYFNRLPGHHWRLEIFDRREAVMRLSPFFNVFFCYASAGDSRFSIASSSWPFPDACHKVELGWCYKVGMVTSECGVWVKWGLGCAIGWGLEDVTS